MIIIYLKNGEQKVVGVSIFWEEYFVRYML